MRLPLWLAGLGFLCLAFAWWGIHTAAGRRTFDEMAGMIPWGVGLGGLLLLLAAAVLWLVRLFTS